MKDTIDTGAKYIIALAVIVGCFALIYTGQTGGDNTQPWSVITLIVGWLIRDSAGNSAAKNVERIAAAQPTVTVDPPQTTVTPSEPAQ